MGSYRDLKVYQLAKEVDELIFNMVGRFPKNEKYSLSDQTLRSTHSIISNIAEGFGRRFYSQEYSRFLIFAQASCDETREHIIAALHRQYCSQEEFDLLDDKLDHIGRMLTLLIRKVRATT